MLFEFYAALVFILGLIIGSYLNVYILRLNTGKDTKGRSACASCGKQLEPYELLPLLSFFLLKGRCSKCKTRISWQYPIVELSNALAYFLIFYFIENKFLAIVFMPLASVSLLITIYDIRHQMIPQKLINFLFVNAFTIFLLTGYLQGSLFNLQTYLDLALSELLFAGVILFLWFITKGKAMGYGDVKLAAALSFLLKPASAWLALTLSFVFGALFSLGFIFFDRIFLKNKFGIQMKSAIAFGPFILLSFWLVLLAQLSVYDIIYLL